MRLTRSQPSSRKKRSAHAFRNGSINADTNPIVQDQTHGYFVGADTVQQHGYLIQKLQWNRSHHSRSDGNVFYHHTNAIENNGHSEDTQQYGLTYAGFDGTRYNTASSQHSSTYLTNVQSDSHRLKSHHNTLHPSSCLNSYQDNVYDTKRCSFGSNPDYSYCTRNTVRKRSLVSCPEFSANPSDSNYPIERVSSSSSGASSAFATRASSIYSIENSLTSYHNKGMRHDDKAKCRCCVITDQTST